jgi:hypothetical protein
MGKILYRIAQAWGKVNDGSKNDLSDVNKSASRSAVHDLGADRAMPSASANLALSMRAASDQTVTLKVKRNTCDQLWMVLTSIDPAHCILVETLRDKAKQSIIDAGGIPTP